MSILTNSDSSVRTYLPVNSQNDWQKELRSAVRDPFSLCQRLELPATWAQQAIQAQGKFPLFVPLSYLGRMEKGNPEDPLLRQVLPVRQEGETQPGFHIDPVGDRQAERQRGMLHKYSGRALLVLTGACAVHCRYCFRQHFHYAELPQGAAAWDQTLNQLAADQSIQEVILSGGDPLMWVDQRLAVLVQKISAIRHVRTLRIHTRLPVMIPNRVTTEMLDWLAGGRLTPIVVLHANHAQELSSEVAEAVERMHRAGTLMLNQAVLLRHVNDSVEAQLALSQQLIKLRIVPYYLHQLDRVQGASHFEVPIEQGQKIIDSLRRQLPGYAVPQYVQEVAGAAYKVPL